jgi:hypothetical protein
MPSWYRVNIPPIQCFRDGKADQLEVMFLTRRSPNDAALFESHDESLRTNVFFFSPEAAAMVKTLIERFGRIECRPSVLSDRLVLLVGRPSVRETLLDTTQVTSAYLLSCHTRCASHVAAIPHRSQRRHDWNKHCFGMCANF